ncbi:carbohydrate-binding protein with CBM35 doain [Labedella gwakjiensis]|uniref:Carbohydrate-binding protein with CBM35 doain n=1 Tax=Labedella gwakjiensis TaxID=390269 RepID=A0A2P8GRC5_9MICO|nr:CBM35 domain-containing protein [Labedella gwakjiensis]PSL36507.1 carbohydrate-binding protein with CBM35 doain [Labedella gwakjiensis]
MKTTLPGIAMIGAVTAALLVPGPAAYAADHTLVVDAGAVLRPVTHVAAGGLYGISDASTPSASILQPLSLRQHTQPPPGVQQLGNGATTPAGDALKVASTVIATGGQQYIRMPDIYPDFPYRWVSWDDWLQKVNKMVDDRLAATSTTNINGWEIWNEPDGTWDTEKAGPYNDGWTRTYRAIRAKDTVTPIIGPGTTIYNPTFMRSFLENAKATNTLPDVIVWHELSQGWQNIDEHVADYRALERSLGISPRPISINEYAWPDQVDVPSAALHYIAQFERTGVNDAERAYWFEAGTMNGLLYNGQPTASYWMYKWYGEMAGNMLPVTADGDLDGIASLDGTRKIANVVFGGDYGNNTVRVDRLTGFGSTVKVVLSSVPGSGRQTNVSAPTTLSTQTLPVVNGSVTIPVSNMDARQSYQALITPVNGPTTAYQQVYEAENATVVNAQRRTSTSASNGGYVGGIDGSADMRSQSFVDFTVNVPSAGTYSLAIRYANGTGATSTQGLAYNGGAWSTISYPPTGAWGQFANSVTTSVSLKAGFNTIRLAKGSPFFAGGTGFAEIDSISVTR